MGNCQAAEAATVAIQHPSGYVERIYWSVSANEVMTTNPGHYVAVVMATVSANGTPVKQLKLLRPDDTLHIGHVYRLISFEEVLKEFAGKKYAKLSKLLSMQKQREKSDKGGGSRANEEKQRAQEEEREGEACGGAGEGRNRGGVPNRRHSRQWRPALQSISEVGAELFHLFPGAKDPLQRNSEFPK